MKQHVNILGALYLALGLIGLVSAIFVFVVLGGVAGIVGLSGAEDAELAIPILGGLGGILFVIIAGLSIPSVIVGLGLMRHRRWARVGGLILSALHIPSMPVGTALGAYGLWVLSSEQAETVFAGTPAQLVG